jgi:hypothetical protein
MMACQQVNTKIQEYLCSYDYDNENAFRSMKSPERKVVHWSSKLVEVLYFDPAHTTLAERLPTNTLQHAILEGAASQYLKDDNTTFVEKGIHLVSRELSRNSTDVTNEMVRSYAIQAQEEEWV